MTLAIVAILTTVGVVQQRVLAISIITSQENQYLKNSAATSGPRITFIRLGKPRARGGVWRVPNTPEVDSPSPPGGCNEGWDGGCASGTCAQYFHERVIIRRSTNRNNGLLNFYAENARWRCDSQLLPFRYFRTIVGYDGDHLLACSILYLGKGGCVYVAFYVNKGFFTY